MAYTNAEARQQLLGTVAETIEVIGTGLSALGAAYEQLDERTADELEAALFRPVQVAYGRAQRTATEFAGRHGLPSPDVAPAAPAAPATASLGARALVERAVEAADEADHILAELQDSLRPVEVGDPELRAGLADVRERLSGVPRAARELLRVLGR